MLGDQALAGFWAVPLVILSLGMAGGTALLRCQAQQTTVLRQPVMVGLDVLGRQGGLRQAGSPLRTAKTIRPRARARRRRRVVEDQRQGGARAARGYRTIVRAVEQDGGGGDRVSVGAERKTRLFGGVAGLRPSARATRQAERGHRALPACGPGYPQQASVHNNLGLCYARQNRLDEAVAALGHAIRLDAKNPLYRNNIAAVLVDQGRVNEAFLHLRAVHGDAAAYYNLGYLLNKKGQPQAALQDFRLALQADPSMDAARRWVEYLQRTMAQARLTPNPIAAGVRVITPPLAPQEAELAPPDEPPPRRLPPTMCPHRLRQRTIRRCRALPTAARRLLRRRCLRH